MNDTTHYLGEPDGKVYRVDVHGHRVQLDPRRDLKCHSQAGFAWGYGGSGPAQLAIAILADATGDEQIATSHYHDFRQEVIRALPLGDPFWLTIDEVRGWLRHRESCG